MACCEWSGGWTEDAKEVCKTCMDREYRLLYDTCPDGRCKGKRDCHKHRHLWDALPVDALEGVTLAADCECCDPNRLAGSKAGCSRFGAVYHYPQPLHADDPSSISPYHRPAATATQEKAQGHPSEPLSPNNFKKYNSRIDAMLGTPPKRKGYKETPEEREARIDAACERLARRIEATRLAEWGDVNSYMGEPLSDVMGIMGDAPDIRSPRKRTPKKFTRRRGIH